MLPFSVAAQGRDGVEGHGSSIARRDSICVCRDFCCTYTMRSSMRSSNVKMEAVEEEFVGNALPGSLAEAIVAFPVVEGASSEKFKKEEVEKSGLCSFPLLE